MSKSMVNTDHVISYMCSFNCLWLGLASVFQPDWYAKSLYNGKVQQTKAVDYTILYMIRGISSNSRKYNLFLTKQGTSNEETVGLKEGDCREIVSSYSWI